jgi:hypothetical protein
MAAGTIELVDAAGRPVPTSPEPEAGKVWARTTRGGDGTLVFQLIDLLDQAADHWDEPREPSPRRTGWRLRWAGTGRTAPAAMSPWTTGGDARRLEAERGAETWRLPGFRRWLVVVRPPG